MITLPKNIGLQFDWHAGQTKQTVLHLDRPLDIAPDDGLVYDAAELAELVSAASGWLYAAGARRGDRIAIIKNNHVDTLVLAAAAARIGAVAATISAQNRPHDHVALLDKLQPIVTVLDAGVLEAARAHQLNVASYGRTFLLPSQSSNGPNDTGLPSLDDLRGSAVPPVDVRPDDEAMMITHTSGTTDTPKLVVHSADTNRAGTRVELLRLPLVVNRRSDVSLSSISFAHSRAYAWIGAQFRWAPKKLVVASSHAIDDVEQVFARHRPTTVEATPNVFQHWTPLVRRRPELFSQVRLYINTFDMMHPSIVRPFLNASKRRFPLWGHSWGQSEVGPIAANLYTRSMIANRDRAEGNHMNLMGWPWPGLMRAVVADPDTGQRKTKGEVGMLMVKSKSLCIDYLDESDRYDFKRQTGWWNTGDVGYKDRLGRIHFLDRAIDQIPGGSATELESVLLDRLENATEVVVLPSAESAPVPVLSTDGSPLTAEAWQEATRDLPALSDPVVLPWSDLPRTSTWKVRRKDLRDTVFAGQNDTTELEERFT
ncbi:AMP-binding protein [Kocuria rhizophila]|uniref:AMP-binding protein n=1 Tax=Kocuria rhizophila TaxID=72000 RepID=UPI0011AA1788|nr:class I adenylate-forming enzyme family protein [Kocuria rhizophila]